jgi:hypothetical protein
MIHLCFSYLENTYAVKDLCSALADQARRHRHPSKPSWPGLVPIYSSLHPVYALHTIHPDIRLATTTARDVPSDSRATSPKCKVLCHSRGDTLYMVYNPSVMVCQIHPYLSMLIWKPVSHRLCSFGVAYAWSSEDRRQHLCGLRSGGDSLCYILLPPDPSSQNAPAHWTSSGRPECVLPQSPFSRRFRIRHYPPAPHVISTLGWAAETEKECAERASDQDRQCEEQGSYPPLHG